MTLLHHWRRVLVTSGLLFLVTGGILHPRAGVCAAAAAEPAPTITVEVTLEGFIPPISHALARFLRTVNASFPGPFVGFEAADRGQGPGNGSDENVPFSVTFPPFKQITAATLALELTPTDRLITTDALTFAAVGLDFAYGRAQLAPLAVGTKTTVVFDLGHLDELDTATQTATGMRDLTPLLLVGQLDVIYADDAIIHRAVLTVEGEPTDPVPTLPPRPPAD
jgi:hypothetical protein